MRDWLILLGLLALFAAGCLMTMQSRLERESEALAQIVRAYCNETTSAELRLAFRTEINERSAPDKILVMCDAEEPP